MPHRDTHDLPASLVRLGAGSGDRHDLGTVAALRRTNKARAGVRSVWLPRDTYTGRKEEPEGPSARRRPKPPTTVGPSGSGAPSNLSQPSWFPGRSTLSLGFGASRASPPAQLVGFPNRTSRCAQSALRLSQGSRPRFPDSAAPAARSEAKCTGAAPAGQPDERAGHGTYALVDRVMERVTRTCPERERTSTHRPEPLRRKLVRGGPRRRTSTATVTCA